MAVAQPVVLRNPYVGIAQAGTAPDIDISCHFRRIVLTPEDSLADVATFCHPGLEAPVTATWTFEGELLQSFGPDASTNPGLWDTLAPLARTLQTFNVAPAAGTNSNTNPMATFEAYVPTMPFLDAGIGESTVLTLSFNVAGDIVVSTT